MPLTPKYSMQEIASQASHKFVDREEAIEIFD
jgi:hypothetical protein